MAYVSHFSDIRLDGEEKTVKQLLAELKDGGGSGVDLGDIETRLAALENPVSISAFTITSPSGALEVGAALTSVGFSWNVSNFAQASSAKIRDVTGSSDLYTVTTASGTHTEAVSITKSAPGTQQYRLEVTDKLERVINSSTQTINWYYPTYFGKSSSTSLDEAAIKALATKTLRAGKAGTYAITAGEGYRYIVYDKSFGTTAQFIDSNTGFAVDMQAPSEVSITINGVTRTMYVYRSTNILNSANSIVIA